MVSSSAVDQSQASSDLLVIGGGVLGLCTAVEAMRRGHDVALVDRGGPNASSVAAGMIAPAMESLADLRRAAGDHSALFRAARDLWPDGAAEHGLMLHREGAEWRGADGKAVLASLRALGFEADVAGQGVFTPDDWRLSPTQAMARLREGLGRRRVVGEVIGLDPHDDGWSVHLEAGVTIRARTVVLAPGATVEPSLRGAMGGVVDLLSPIKGQLGFTPERLVSHAVRGDAGYVAPTDGGSVIGATMQAGLTDLAPDEPAGEALVAACLEMIGAPRPERLEWRVGVRGSTPDGLPLAGAVGDGLFVAIGPRRNGWLLGPLVAGVVIDAVEGRTPGPWAEALDPGRFTRRPGSGSEC